MIIFAGGLRLVARVQTISRRFFCRLENKKVRDVRSHRDDAVFSLGIVATLLNLLCLLLLLFFFLNNCSLEELTNGRDTEK